MELTRRRAVTTILAGGLGTSAGVWSLSTLSEATEESEAPSELTDSELELIESLAEIVYPSELSTGAVLVESYLRYQPPDRLREIRNASRSLDISARRRYGAPFATLTASESETLLREMGVDRAAPDRDGTVPERVRHYLVNGLLYALFTDPAGSRLVGIDNPRGYPGGYESYAEPPRE